MTEPIFALKDIKTLVNRNTPNESMILKGINLDIQAGDFITIIGTNGAGKSTLFNVISGSLLPDSGAIYYKGKNITNLTEEKRSRFLSRVFQDPKLGTAPRMTVSENLLLAARRGERRRLIPRGLKLHREEFAALVATMHNGLEKRLDTFTENLSGGQRQALSFLMATIKRPDILLLDEHTAALDPNTSAHLMAATNNRITQDHLTALMITHHLEDALRYGNRLLVLDNGKIIHDFKGAAKTDLTLSDLRKLI